MDVEPSSYWDVLDETSRRVADAVGAQAGLTSATARNYVRNVLAKSPGMPGSLFGEPVFEPAAHWQDSGETMRSLAGNLISEELVESLAKAKDRQAVPRDRTVYSHQLSAWRAALGADQKSFVVTSGTGSGKTECFMIPILEDLVRNPPQPGGGVRALMLYPLNALIESQRRRLDAWLSAMGGNARYALYKGDMPERLNSGQRQQVSACRTPDRVSLRERPPEVLVTNVTMLEFMMVRPQDRSILDRSQNGLRWIVLDEAHTYSGAQAAEIAMLLRRVREAFGVAPEQLRLLATSATIGGSESGEDLQRFVADLADLPTEQVEVINGQRQWAALPEERSDAQPPTESAIIGADESELYSRLGSWPRMREAIRELRSGHLSLWRAGEILGLQSPDATVRMLEAAGRAKADANGPALAPWRMHTFLRAQPGLWSCVDAKCSEADRWLESDRDWPFGMIYVSQRERCECGAPVFEVESCSACATPRLRVQLENGAHRRLVQPQDFNDKDEYALELDPGDEHDQTGATELSGLYAVLPVSNGDLGQIVWCDLATGRLADREAPQGDHFAKLAVGQVEETHPCCGETNGTARRARFGAPFLLGAALPSILRAAQPHEKAKHPADLPSFGRRLLTFTDSRQGTARFAAKLQQEAERSLVRSVIWHRVSEPPEEPENAEELRYEIANLKEVASGNPRIQQMIAEKEEKLHLQPKVVGWDDMVESLANNTELIQWASRIWKSKKRENGRFGEEPRQLARMLIYREVLRRPKFLNNVETLGLSALICPKLVKSQAPQRFVDAGRYSDDWQDFLRLFIDFVFRQGLAAEVDGSTMHWASPSRMSRPGFVAPPGSASPSSSGGRAWPRAATGQRSPVVRFAYRMLKIGEDDQGAHDAVNDILREVFTTLRSRGVIRERGPEEWVLNYGQLAFAPVTQAWRCPITRRVLSYAPLGLTPYGALQAQPIRMPELPIARWQGLSEHQRSEVRSWLLTDEYVAAARQDALWTDIHDRAAMFEPFFRAAEHSAQVARRDLTHYERDFDEGKLNILACSTTMEMGVDIAGVSVVTNTNVPPSPANYRQRVGRAGRRNEPRALALTFCGDRPHDWTAFANPQRALLDAKIDAPSVRLDSPVIVQRHVNSFLLAAFLREWATEGTVLRMPAGKFFGGTRQLDGAIELEAPADLLLQKLRQRKGFHDVIYQRAKRLVKGTVLEGAEDLADRSALALESVIARWRGECRGILDAAAGTANEPNASKALAYRLRRHYDEFLLKELAKRGFTPAYGFPTDIIQFDAPTLRQADETAAESITSSSAPSRSMETAIREYAPGADVVIDGLVHRSSGVALAWSQPHDATDVEDLRMAWKCKSCLAFGTDPSIPATCPDCGSVIESSFKLLRPSGFVSDTKPHARYEAADFNPPTAPWVSARGGNTRSLPDPTAGSLRVAREGTILHHDGSPHNEGYALCLVCGRAEPEFGPSTTHQLPAKISEHYPLSKGRQENAGEYCSGSGNLIQRNVRLGAELTTDVVELHLYELAGNEEGTSIGLAIGSALREALARRIGVEAQDMGVLARAQPSEQQHQMCVGIILYDRAPGGAGFAPLLADQIQQIFEDAKRILDCPSGDACVNGCPQCVLARDLQHDREGLNRSAAFEWLVHQVLPKLSTPQHLKIFGDHTFTDPRSLPEVIDQIASRNPSANIDIFLHGNADSWDLSGWNLRSILKGRGEGISLIAESGPILQTSWGQQLGLHRFLSETGAILAKSRELPKSTAGQPILAQVFEGETTYSYAVAEKEGYDIGPNWGAAEYGPLLYAECGYPVDRAKVDPNRLMNIGRDNALRIDVENELDGDVSGFGKRFWQRLLNAKPQIAARVRAAQVVNVRYADRYLKSPLTVLLLKQILKTVPRKGEVPSVQVVSHAYLPGNSWEKTMSNDWNRYDTRDRVLRRLIGNMGTKSDICSLDYKDTQHDRELMVQWDNGEKLRIVLDQGFGAWRAVGNRVDLFHRFAADPRTQAELIENSRFDVVLKGNRMPIFVETSHTG